MLFDMWKYLHSESLFNTLRIEIKHKCQKKFPSGKIDVTKNAVFFFHEFQLSFTFNSQFLYKLKHLVCLSKTLSGIFYSWFRLVNNKI